MLMWTYNPAVIEEPDNLDAFLRWCEDNGLPAGEITANPSFLPYVVQDGEGALQFIANRIYRGPGNFAPDPTPVGLICNHDPAAPHVAAYTDSWPVTTVPPIPSGATAQTAVSA